MAAAATGPRTPEGKARSSQNARKHGLSAGFLHIPEAERATYNTHQEAWIADMEPKGAIELECVIQMCEAAWRLRRIRILQNELALKNGEDPLTHPDTAAAMKQLERYRAAQEMIYYRAIKMLRGLQTRRAVREVETDEVEDVLLPPHVEPVVFSKTKYNLPARQAMRDLAGYGYPGTKFTLDVDDFGYGAWVPVDAPALIHQNELRE